MRVQNLSVTFEQNGNIAYLQPLEVTPELAKSSQSGLKVKIRLRKGNESGVIDRRVSIDVVGVICSAKYGWEALTPESKLTGHKLRSSMFQVFLPSLWKIKNNFNDLALMEGPVFLSKLWQRPNTIQYSIGVGAPLIIQRPYNCPAVDRILTFAKEVVETGEIKFVEFHEADIHIHLHRAIEPGKEHRIIFWLQNGTIETLSNIAQDGNTWSIHCPEVERMIVALGIAYGGEWIGGWWTNDLDQLLEPGMPLYCEPKITAAMIRWLKLPILKYSWRKSFSAFGQKNLPQTLSAWLDDDGLPEGLSFSSHDDVWMFCVRQLFSDYIPNNSQTNEIINVFGEERDPFPLVRIIHRLIRIDPTLMGRILLAYKDVNIISNDDQKLFKLQLKIAQRNLLNLTINSADDELRKSQEKALQEIAEDMKVDLFFARNLVARAVGTLKGVRLSSWDEENLTISLSIYPFRKLLSSCILEEVIRA